MASRSVRWRVSPPSLPPVSIVSRRSSRWSIRSASSSSGSARSRTAASSMASGMPSSRRHSRITSARFASLTVNPGSTAAARRANSSMASVVPWRGGVVTGQAEPGEDVAALAGHVQRLPAGGEHRDLARLGDDGLGEQRAGVDDVLAGVEDQQHALVAQVREHRVELRAARLLGQAELSWRRCAAAARARAARTAGRRTRRRGTRPRPARSRAAPPASCRRRPGRPA